MKRLTVLAMLTMPALIAASFDGMNFRKIPTLGMEFGFRVAIDSMGPFQLAGLLG
jgi:Mg2+ and Co2+ transporter CorA